RLHELIRRGAGECARRTRRNAGEAAELPVQADRTQARRSGQLIVGDVVNLERAGVDVAQDQVGRAGRMDRRNASVLPVETDVAQEERAGDLVVADVVELEPA